MRPPGHWCPSQPRPTRRRARTGREGGVVRVAPRRHHARALWRRSRAGPALKTTRRRLVAAAAGRASEFGRTDLPRRLLDTPGPGRAGPGPSDEQANTRNAYCRPAGRCRLRGRDSSTPVDPAGASESRTALEPNAAAERASTSCRPARKARRRAATPAPHGWNRRARSARWRRQGARFEPTFSRQSVVRSRGLVIAAAI